MTEKRKGLLGAVGSFFVEEVPDDPQTMPPPSPPPVASAPFAPPITPSIDPERAKKLDEAAASQLSASMEKAAGSYAELTSNMEVLAEAIPDEGQRMKAAMKMLAKKGVHPEKVLSDIDACLGALEAESRTFQDATKDQIEQRVGSKRKALEQTKEQVAAKQGQIVAIQNEIAALQASILSAASDIASEEENINVVQTRFTGVYNRMKASLAAQRAKIAQGI